jgi:hypothetical protein
MVKQKRERNCGNLEADESGIAEDELGFAT